MTPRLLYGGTFDPVHAGHVAVARAASVALAVDVAFVPAADPPHRPGPGASALQRAAMLELALQGEPGMSVDRRELDRSGPSFTVDTLRSLRAESARGAPLAWLIGADAFRGLPQWHDWQELFGLAHFVVAVRPGHGLEALPPALADACTGRWCTTPAPLRTEPAGRLYRLDMPLHPASATELRRRLRAGEPHGGWLAPGVAAFIADNGLYRAGTGPGGV